MKLTRRDRAAMQLALEVLRNHRRFPAVGLGQAADVLGYGPPRLEEWAAPARWSNRSPRSARLLRARLALYLRAVLRADAGHYVEWRCSVCGEEAYASARFCYRDGDGPNAIPMEPHRRITPLWERAAAHGGEHA
jgi:hypothetical protein